ncbi:hypothetical protein ACLESO_37465 [Pyxidicoccus sp. 3LG]
MVRASLPFLPGVLACVLALAACGPVETPDDAVACAGVRCTAGTCVANGGQPMCRCSSWEATAGLRCEVGAFEQEDDHGGSPADATPLSAPMTPRQARIGEGLREGMRDRDLFTFTATERHGYAFYCEHRTLTDCKLRLLDASGRESSLSVVQGGITRMGYALVEAGTWYVEVSGGELPGGKSLTGTYQYRLVDLGADDHGDTPARATALQSSRESFPVTHSSPHDRDVFRFRSVPGHGHRFRCQQPGNRFLELLLMTANGEVRERVNGPTGPWIAVGLRRVDREEDWYVELRAQADDTRLASSCWYEDLGTDEHADGMTGATPLTPGIPVPTTLQWMDDVDMFSFVGEPGHVYSVRGEGQGSLQAAVVDVNGSLLKSGFTGSLSFKPQASGTYYLRITGSAPWFYSLLLELVDVGVDDHGDFPENATAISPGGSVAVRFETPQDQDAIQFTAETDGIYEATCEPACEMSFRYEGAINFLSTGSGRMLIDASRAAPVTLLLHPRSGVENVTLRLARVATDDHGDNVLTAQALTLPASVSGRVQTAVDGDAFKVWLDAGRSYRLGLDLGSLTLAVTGPQGFNVTPRDGVLTANQSGTYLLLVYGATGLTELPWSFTLHTE